MRKGTICFYQRIKQNQQETHFNSKCKCERLKSHQPTIQIQSALKKTRYKWCLRLIPTLKSHPAVTLANSRWSLDDFIYTSCAIPFSANYQAQLDNKLLITNLINNYKSKPCAVLSL